MKKYETRRVTPVAYIAAIVVSLLVGLEIVAISGVLELRSSTVERYVPWAAASYRKMVGEEAESKVVSLEAPAAEVPEMPSLNLGSIAALIGTNEAQEASAQPAIATRPAKPAVKSSVNETRVRRAPIQKRKLSKPPKRKVRKPAPQERPAKPAVQPRPAPSPAVSDETAPVG